jgi:hypothetical protein
MLFPLFSDKVVLFDQQVLLIWKYILKIECFKSFKLRKFSESIILKLFLSNDVNNDDLLQSWLLQMRLGMTCNIIILLPNELKYQSIFLSLFLWQYSFSPLYFQKIHLLKLSLECILWHYWKSLEIIRKLRQHLKSLLQLN